MSKARSIGKSAKEGGESGDDPNQSNSDRIDLELGTSDTACGTMKEMIEGNNEELIDLDLNYIQTTLRHFPWYHGLIQSAHVIQFLKWDNSYLVRRTAEGGRGKEYFCLSYRQSNRICHYAIRFEDGFWTCPRIFTDLNPKQRFPHIHTMLDFWSMNINVIPVPRSKKVIYHDDVKLIKILGAGAFGEVWKGTIMINGVANDCAVKKIKGQVKKAQLTAFFHEANIMSVLDHENVIKFYGQCTLVSPMMAVMELAAGGVVRSYLRHNKNVNILILSGMVNDIAKGMDYLSSRKVIHRDLAARNCLLDEKLNAKISDFGLSVRDEEIRVKNLKQAPIRWLSPETIKIGLFNEKTDVWAFGVTVWEIFTHCKRHPLYPKNIKDAILAIREVEKPHKFIDVKPPKSIVALVESCTRRNPNERPKFRALIGETLKILEKGIKKAAPDSRRRPVSGKFATEIASQTSQPISSRNKIVTAKKRKKSSHAMFHKKQASTDNLSD